MRPPMGEKEITVRASKISLGVIVVIGLLAGSAVGVAAQDTDEGGAATEAEAMRPAMVTGTFLVHYESDETTGRVETNDRRLNGEVTPEWTVEDIPDLILPEETGGLSASKIAEYEEFGAELSWASLRITNDDGWWDGHSVCTPTLFTNGTEDPCFIELSGAGGHDGLSALLVTRDRLSAVGYEPRDETYQLDGLVFPGDLPPDR